MRKGDRQDYETNYFRRRWALSHLVIAECLINDGRYLDKIIDHIWAIVGEIQWCVPAHNFAGQHDMVMYKSANEWKPDDPLPLPDDEYLDLFNCETAATLAEACYLLKPVLIKTTPSLYHLVHKHIEERTLAKFEGPKLYGWYNGKNNWTAWCAHNLLLAASYVIEDKSRLINFTNKLMLLMHWFFENIEDSGSCIEGPSYWVVSAGRLIGFVDLVETRFQTDLGFETSAKFRNFGEHIVQLHIGDNAYVNFSDGSLRLDLDHGLLSRYARKIGAQTLTNLIWDDVERVAARKLGRSVADRGHNEYARQFLVHLTRLLFWTPEVTATNQLSNSKSVWLEDMQVMIARQSEQAEKGLALSCIAGSNDTIVNHHSHNDIGHFSVYLDGEPLIIDLGQGVYSRETFSDQRYAMWHISSEGHNVPKINGLLQRPGKGADATDVQFVYDGKTSSLTFDATLAYYPAPTPNKISRQIVFDHEIPEIHIEDIVSIADGLTRFELPLYVSERDITVLKGGMCRIQGANNAIIVKPQNLRLDRVDTVDITDPRHVEMWGPRIRKIVFMAKDVDLGRFSMTIGMDR